MNNLRITLSKLFDAGRVSEIEAVDFEQFKQDAINEAERNINEQTKHNSDADGVANHTDIT